MAIQPTSRKTRGDLGEKVALGTVGGKTNPPIRTALGNYYPDGVQRSADGSVARLVEVKNWSGGTLTRSTGNIPKLLEAAKTTGAQPRVVVNRGVNVAASLRNDVQKAGGEIVEMKLPGGISRTAAAGVKGLGLVGTAFVGVEVVHQVRAGNVAGAACTIGASVVSDECAAGAAGLLVGTGVGAPLAIVGGLGAGVVCYQFADRACHEAIRRLDLR